MLGEGIQIVDMNTHVMIVSKSTLWDAEGNGILRDDNTIVFKCEKMCWYNFGAP